ncbi:F0F1 ATP synthase subunit A [Alphaproteobacteria bacterium]|nr:F0F1 ATP synthase subunit A [Alphaproteobacteria bacterium]
MENPLKQFLIKPLIPLDLGGFDITFTNASLFMVLSFGLISLLFIRCIAHGKIVPGRFQVVAETFVNMIYQLVNESVGTEGRKYFPLIFSFFIFILFGNLLGLIPGAFTFTSHILVTLSLGFVVFFLITFVGFAKHGVKFFGKFLPPGVPWPIIPIIVSVEVISFLFHPFSLGVRLFANMLAGHVVLKVFASFTIALGWLGIVPLLTNVIFTGFEIFVACLQAYIFTVLSCAYLSDVLHLDH